MRTLNTLVILITTLLLANPVNAKAQVGKERWLPILGHLACKSVNRFRHCKLTGTEIDKPAEGIRRVQYHFKVGEGQFDTITVHRVMTVKNKRRTRSLMLLPGTGLDVENVYLPALKSNAVPDDYSPLITFARRGIDAWSADYRGSDLPLLDDYSFMADWGLETATEDMQLAIRFARLVRLFSGNGYRRMTVGGYSSGVAVAFAVAGKDAVRHRSRRDVNGLVAIDDTFDVGPDDRDAACFQLQGIEQRINDGIFHDDLTGLIQIATMARDFPDAPVPPEFEFPGTFLQLLNVFVVLPSGPTPFHIFGGQFDDLGFPFPVFTPQGLVIDQGTLFEPALPLQFDRERFQIRCSEDAVSKLDGSLSKIKVPVLHIGAAGGNANAIDHTLSQLRSRDVTSIIIQLLPPEAALFDYGHGDVFAATDAEARVWQPIADWMKAR
ncbi:MAG: hypothetical protein AAF438_00195 [Pseudomonadota bacterium]